MDLRLLERYDKLQDVVEVFDYGEGIDYQRSPDNFLIMILIGSTGVVLCCLDRGLQSSGCWKNMEWMKWMDMCKEIRLNGT